MVDKIYIDSFIESCLESQRSSLSFEYEDNYYIIPIILIGEKIWQKHPEEIQYTPILVTSNNSIFPIIQSIHNRCQVYANGSFISLCNLFDGTHIFTLLDCPLDRHLSTGIIDFLQLGQKSNIKVPVNKKAFDISGFKAVTCKNSPIWLKERGILFNAKNRPNQKYSVIAVNELLKDQLDKVAEMLEDEIMQEYKNPLYKVKLPSNDFDKWRLFGAVTYVLDKYCIDKKISENLVKFTWRQYKEESVNKEIDNLDYSELLDLTYDFFETEKHSKDNFYTLREILDFLQQCSELYKKFTPRKLGMCLKKFIADRGRKEVSRDDVGESKVMKLRTIKIDFNKLKKEVEEND